MHVLAGRAYPAWKACRGFVAIQLRPLRPLFGYQAYRAMRLPHVHLWSGLPRLPVGLLVGVAALAQAELDSFRQTLERTVVIPKEARA